MRKVSIANTTTSVRFVVIVISILITAFLFNACAPPPPLTEVEILQTEAAALERKAAAVATLTAAETLAAAADIPPTETPVPEPPDDTDDTLTSTATIAISHTPTTTPAPIFTSTPVPPNLFVKVQSSKLNVRKGPATSHGIVTQVRKNKTLAVHERTEKADWIRITTPKGEDGWVSVSPTDIGDRVNEVPVAKDPPTPPPCRTGTRGMIAFKSSRGGIWVMNGDGSNQMPMCNPNRYYSALGLRSHEYCSKDGLYCVEVRHHDVYVEDREYGSGWHQIVSNDNIDWDPRIHPEGYWVVFVTNRNGNDELWLISREVTGERRLTINDWQWDKHPSWSPDGNRIVFYSNRVTGRKQLWVLDPNTPLREKTNPRNISRNRSVDSDPVWLK